MQLWDDFKSGTKNALYIPPKTFKNIMQLNNLAHKIDRKNRAFSVCKSELICGFFTVDHVYANTNDLVLIFNNN